LSFAFCALAGAVLIWLPLNIFWRLSEKKPLPRWYYYERNKANYTTKIQPLAVFTKKGNPFIYRHFIGKPSSDTCACHSFGGQSAGDKAISYASEGVNQAAYTGIDASQDSEPVFDGSKGAHGRVLR